MGFIILGFFGEVVLDVFVFFFLVIFFLIGFVGFFGVGIGLVGGVFVDWMIVLGFVGLDVFFFGVCFLIGVFFLIGLIGFVGVGLILKEFVVFFFFVVNKWFVWFRIFLESLF